MSEPKKDTRTVLERLQEMHYEADQGYIWAEDDLLCIRGALRDLLELLIEQEEAKQ